MGATRKDVLQQLEFEILHIYTSLPPQISPKTKRTDLFLTIQSYCIFSKALGLVFLNTFLLLYRVHFFVFYLSDVITIHTT